MPRAPTRNVPGIVSAPDRRIVGDSDARARAIWAVRRRSLVMGEALSWRRFEGFANTLHGGGLFSSSAGRSSSTIALRLELRVA
jgi:hypothetical protein